MSDQQACGEQREQEEVGEGVLEDDGDEHQGVRHASLLQCAIRDRRAAQASGREQVRGGEAGEVDAQRQSEREWVAQQVEEAAEEQRVEEDGDALDGHGCGQPGGRGLTHQFECVALPREARDDEEQRHDDDHEDDRRAPGVAAARYGGVAQRLCLPPRRCRGRAAVVRLDLLPSSSPSTSRSISPRRIHA